MADLDERFNLLRRELQQATLPDFDDVLVRRRRRVRRQRLAGGAAVLGLAVAAVPLVSLPLHDHGKRAVPAADPRYPQLEPVVSDCGLPSWTTRPVSITLTCADAGITATDLVWSSWEPRTAEATGTVRVRGAVGAPEETAQVRLDLTAARDGVFDHAAMTFTSAPPAHWRGATPTTDYALPDGGLTPPALAVTDAMATFTDAAVSPEAKSGLVQGGADPADLRLVFGILPPANRGQVVGVTVDGSRAVVRYHLTAASAAPGGPAEATATLVDGRWLLTSSWWSALVTHSDVHGSG